MRIRLLSAWCNPPASFIVGQLGKFADAPWDDARKLVDKAHRELPDHVKHTAFVSAEGLEHKGDKVHFDAESCRELGRRYARAYLKLTKHAFNGSDAPANIVLMKTLPCCDETARQGES